MLPSYTLACVTDLTTRHVIVCVTDKPPGLMTMHIYTDKILARLREIPPKPSSTVSSKVKLFLTSRLLFDYYEAYGALNGPAREIGFM